MVVVWHGDSLRKAAYKVAIDMARIDTEVLKEKAVNKAPLRKSPLRNSATVTPIRNGGELSFNTKYALIQHERHFVHYTTPGTGPNYLRGPLQEFKPQYEKDIARAIDAVLGSGRGMVTSRLSAGQIF